MRAIQTHVIIFFVLVITVTASTRDQKTPHVRNNHELSIAIEEMEKANYFSFVMLINMLNTTDPRFLANITFLMPRDKTLSRSNVIEQDSVSEFLLRHSIPSPLPFEHLNLIPNGSTVPSSLPHYTLRISNGGRSSYFLNNVKIISRNICNLGSIKCHGIDGILLSPSTVDDDSPRDNHTSPFISCPSSHNNSEHNSHENIDHNSHGSSDQNSHGSSDQNSHDNSGHNSSRPDPTPTHHTAPPPASNPTLMPKSDSSKLRNGDMPGFIITIILGLIISAVIGTGMVM